MAALTGQEIIDKFESFVDDSLDSDLELQLVNDAKDEIERTLELSICKTVNSSKSSLAGGTYLNAISIASITDFLAFSKPYIYVGTYKYYGVDQADRMKWKDTPYRYFYDPTDGIHLCGTQNVTQVITIPYIKATPDLTLDTSPIWPSFAHALIPMAMASIFYPIEAGIPFLAWTPQWEQRYQRLMDRFKDWDMKMKMAAVGGRTGYRDDDSQGIPLGNM